MLSSEKASAALPILQLSGYLVPHPTFRHGRRSPSAATAPPASAPTGAAPARGTAAWELGLTNLHRPIEQFGLLLSRPAFVITSGALFMLWIGLNLDLKFTTHKPWDEAPFWLQGLIGALGLLVATTVLVSQSRQAQLAEQRAQLQLQFIVLTEQRTA